MPVSSVKRIAAFLIAWSLAAAAGGVREATAQDAPVAPAATSPSLPTLPADSMPATVDAPAAREAQLEERVRQLEAMVQQLAGQVGQSAQTAAAPIPTAPAVVGAAPPQAGANPATNANYSHATGPLAPGQGLPTVPAPSDKDNMPYKPFNFPVKGRFGPGFEWRTDDDEYVLQFHNLTQVDSRTYGQGGQQPVKDTFVIPRQWFMFSGRLGKPYEYFVSLQHGFDAVSLLDVFLNVHYDDRFQFKFGRYKTPFTYEFYQLPIQGLIQPERSLFFNNFGLNRQVGATAWGQLFDKKLDYSTAILNSARNGFVDTNDSKNVTGYLNWRPFLEHDGSFLQYLNVGGSVLAGNNINSPIPQTLRTVVATSGNSTIGVPFMTFNNNAREAGNRQFWDMHAALYYQRLSVVGEWQSGSQQYALTNNIHERTRIPVESFYVQAGYFLTGETVTGRNVVNPINNFDLRPGFRGLGAIELTGRYNYLTMGNQVFSGGFADPNQWSRNLYTTDVGVNWSWTQNIRWTFDWEHAVFGNSVLFAPGRYQKTSDLFLVRMQVFF